MPTGDGAQASTRPSRRPRHHGGWLARSANKGRDSPARLAPCAPVPRGDVWTERSLGPVLDRCRHPLRRGTLRAPARARVRMRGCKARPLRVGPRLRGDYLELDIRGISLLG